MNITRVTMTAVAFFGLLLSAGSANAADSTVGVDFSTAYIFRGVALNDGFVMQPYLETEASEWGLTFGVWGNFDLEEGPGGTPESSQFSETDIYVSYELPLDIKDLSASFSYIEYLYPNSDAKSDRELNLIVGLDTLLTPTLGIYVGVDGAISEQVYLESSIGHEFPLSDDFALSTGALVAVLFQGEESDAHDGFSHASISAGLSYSFLSASVAYYFETDKDVTQVDEHVLGTIGASFSF